jgi:O-acetyl-ADP-ribose deacetylase (regulator of RNase III)
MNTIEGNILRAKEGVICQQVNCLGVMGAGLAAQIKLEYPDVYAEYRQLCFAKADDNYTLLGQIQIIPVSDRKWIVNLFAQYDVGGTRATEYSAFSQCVNALSEWVAKTGEPLWKSSGGSGKIPVLLPYKIGCGLGGGDWSIIREIIHRKLPDSTIYKYKP